MFKNQYKTLALFICGVAGTFQKSLCTKLTNRALELGYNLAIFNAFKDYTYKGNDAYTVGETNIINLPPYEKLAGIIVVPDTFSDDKFREALIKTIKERAKCPVISIRSSYDGFYNIMIDNESAMESIITHFIVEHKMTKFAFINGPEWHQDAIARGACFRNMMEKYNLPVREDWVINGTFWFDRGKEHVDKLLAGPRETWPEAVICANDYMAVAVCDECFERGIKVPEDIAISGFDNLPETMTCYPPLTTVDVSISGIIDTCFDIIQNKPSIPENECEDFRIPTKDIYRCSCGCESMDIKVLLSSVRSTREECDAMFRAARSNTYMSVRLQEINNYNEIGRFIIEDYNNFRNLFICLCGKSTDKGVEFEPCAKGYSEKLMMVYGIKDRKEVAAEDFDYCNIIPDAAVCDKPVQYYFTPLHYQDKTFGFVIHSYDNGGCFDKTFQNWMTVIGNAVENIRTKLIFSDLVEELNSQYLHESMTGLYNRRGFDIHSKEMYEKAVSEQKKMMILEIDMDNLKQVNDEYGHSEGDRAIDIIADALKLVTDNNNAICSRVGGDEFWVIAYDYNKEMQKVYIDNLMTTLEMLDIKENKPYDVAVSYGSVITDPLSGITLEEYINIVDARMYKNKRERKKGRRYTLSE